MRWRRSIRWIHALLAGTLAVGCNTPKQIHYFGEADFSYYREKTLQVEYSNADQATPAEVVYSQRPRTVKDRDEVEAWNLTLAEAIHTAVANNKLIRTRTNTQQLVANPNNITSIYDPALRATGFLFGNRGVEAALADFDAQFTTSMIWGRNENVSNALFGNAVLPPGFVNTAETGQFQSQLAKTFADGGQVALSHNWNYLGSNNPGLLFPSAYNGVSQIGYTRPLWAGAGTEYTRIAGPARSGLGGLLGVNQGVTIARINEDISVADFENSVITMVKDVEDLYWELYLAYRQYDAEIANRDSALRSWREVKAKMEVGASGGNAAAEAQGRENYFETRARVEIALSSIYQNEQQLRRLIGLPVNDGRLIRPADNPLEAEYLVNWETSLSEALTKRPELRRQKWQIKSLELQRIAAENACNPQLNFVSSYQVNGFGDKLLSYNAADGATAAGYNSAYGTMTRGDQTGWNLGLQFAMPIGLRAAQATLQNTELQLVKARAALAAQELDISHELAEAIQRVDVAYTTARTNFDRRVASERRVQATEAEYEAGVRDATLDLVLRAQASKALAEIAYFRSLVDYNKALIDLNQKRGTALEINGISVAEGEWTAAAQQEAVRRAWARSYAKPNPRVDTEPSEFSSPYPYPKTDLFPGVPVGGAPEAPPQPQAEAGAVDAAASAPVGTSVTPTSKGTTSPQAIPAVDEEPAGRATP